LHTVAALCVQRVRGVWRSHGTPAHCLVSIHFLTTGHIRLQITGPYQLIEKSELNLHSAASRSLQGRRTQRARCLGYRAAGFFAAGVSSLLHRTCHQIKRVRLFGESSRPGSAGISIEGSRGEVQQGSTVGLTVCEFMVGIRLDCPSVSWGAQSRSKDAKTPNAGPAMSEKPIFYQLFNKLTPTPARPSDLKLADWKPGIDLLSAGGGPASCWPPLGCLKIVKFCLLVYIYIAPLINMVLLPGSAAIPAAAAAAPAVPALLPPLPLARPPPRRCSEARRPGAWVYRTSLPSLGPTSLCSNGTSTAGCVSRAGVGRDQAPTARGIEACNSKTVTRCRSSASQLSLRSSMHLLAGTRDARNNSGTHAGT
jgi:hypothetical protein